MMIRTEIELFHFRDITLADGVITARELMRAELSPLDRMPVKLMIGVAGYKIGWLENIRKGREAVFATLCIALDGNFKIEGLEEKDGKFYLKGDTYEMRPAL